MKNYKDLLLPDEYVHSIFDIDYDKKKVKGIKHILFDLDGTIVAFDSLKINKDKIDLIHNLKKQDLKIALYSDGKESRIKPIINELQIPYIYRAKKPFGSFKIIYNLFGEECNPYNTMLIGNTSFLDILFANRIGIHNVLVDTVKGDFNIKSKICETGDAIFTYPIRDDLREYGVKRNRNK